MIDVRGLRKSYGVHEAVRGLTFQIPSGQICGFLGPNGAGKSTTLRMLTGYLAPTEGEITIGGIDALSDSIRARAQIGYMPELCPLYPEMRVVEYLRYRAELKGVARAERGRAVERALAQATVEDVAFRIIGQLSKGYRQRVGLADALVADPPLLVLDEPTAGLDPNQIVQVRKLIQELSQDKTLLISTHILPEVEALCDRVLILHKGRLVSDGSPSELSQRKEEVSVSLVGRGEIAAFERVLGGLEGASGVRVRATKSDAALVRASVDLDGGEEATERVFAAVAGAGLVLRELSASVASLEETFAALTTGEEE